jgi:HK97 family phage prohead protease
VIGHGAELESQPDALYGRFRVLKGADGDKALELVAEKVLTAASVYFAPIRSARTPNGMHRLKVKLDRVALCREGSYPGAEVLAVRHEPLPPEVVISPIERLPALSPELTSALAERGLTIPDRLSA